MNALANNKLAMKTLGYLTQVPKKLTPYSIENSFLKGPFAPVRNEIYSTDLKVTGEIPKNLNGLFLRMGPNPLEVSNPALHHWFLGDGMVHGIRLQDGQALWYKNRYVGTHKVHDKLNRPRIKGNPRGFIDVTNTNIIGHAGKIWTLIESGPLPVEMDFDLNSQRYSHFNNEKCYEFTAHPHTDPDTGELHAICYDALVLNKIFYHVIDKNGKLTKRISIPVQHGPMVHDCAMTKSQMVIFDLPVTFSVSSILRGVEFPYRWNKKHKARIGLLPKDGTAKDIQWFKVDPCYVFHSCNAYDLENGNVIVDVVVHEKLFTDSIQGPFDKQQISFERWHLDRKTGKVKRTVISTTPQEFPRFDERLTGKPYRYAYTITLGPVDQEKMEKKANLSPNYLLRYDLDTGKTTKHFYGDGYSTGEVIFIPRTPESAEDDGWLISYVHSVDPVNVKPTQVVILDAKNIEGEPQAVIELPVRVPLGFHSNWVNQE